MESRKMGPMRKLPSSKVVKNEVREKIMVEKRGKIEEEETEEEKYMCHDHEIVFGTEEALLYHIRNDCANMLKKKNVCTHVDENGKCCGQSFRIGSMLILHYARIHELNACDICYATFITTKELAEHQHDERVNVRLSK